MNTNQMKLTLMKWWCLLLHRKHRVNYWTQVGAEFYRCRKCGIHYANRE